MGPTAVRGELGRRRHSCFDGVSARSLQACMPPSRATARMKPSWRKVSAAKVEIFPNSQQVTICGAWGRESLC